MSCDNDGGCGDGGVKLNYAQSDAALPRDYGSGRHVPGFSARACDTDMFLPVLDHSGRHDSPCWHWRVMSLQDLLDNQGRWLCWHWDRSSQVVGLNESERFLTFAHASDKSAPAAPAHRVPRTTRVFDDGSSRLVHGLDPAVDR